MRSASLAGEEFIDTVDEIVAHLRNDPVLVEEVMGGGNTPKLEGILHQKSELAHFPVFVVYTVTPRGMAPESADEEIASLLHAALDQDGVYVVHTSDGTGHVGVWGDLIPAEQNDAVLVSLAISEAERQIDPVIKATGKDIFPQHTVTAAAALDVAARNPVPYYTELELTATELESYQDPMWSTTQRSYTDHPEKPELLTAGFSSLIATLVGVLVLVCAYRLLQAFGARSLVPAASGLTASKVPPPPSMTKTEHATQQLEQLGTRARNELNTLEKSLASDWTRKKAGPERCDLAANSHDSGVALLDSDDVFDLIGALMLARTGSRALSKRGATHYRCCYVNPLHGEGTQRATVAGGLEVPVCGPCRNGLRAGRLLDALIEVRRRAIDKPYYSGETVWAETGFGSLVDDLWRYVDQAGRQ